MCSTPGDRTSSIIPTSTTSFPPAALPSTVPDGSIPRAASSCLFKHSAGSSAASSSLDSGNSSQQDKLQFHGSISNWPHPAAFASFLWQLGQKDWVVYAKPPFGGAEHVLNYLARYTHRVAISNHRLVAFENDRVSFRWRDYAHGGKKKVMTVSAHEFLRRFLLHVLPGGLVRIRHFGFFANRRRGAALERCRDVARRDGMRRSSRATQPRCPACSGIMLVVERFTRAQLYFRPSLSLATATEVQC